MHNTTALWDELFSNPDHYKIITARIAGIEYNEALIESCTVSGKVFDAPTVGRCVARELDLSFMPQGEIPRLAKIELFVALTDGTQTSERLPKGVFYIDTRQTDTETGKMTIKGYDAILMMEQAFEMPSTEMRVVFDYGGNYATFYPALGSPTPTPDPFYKPGIYVKSWTPELDEFVTRNMRYTACDYVVIDGVWKCGDNAYVYKTGDALTVIGHGDMYDYGTYGNEKSPFSGTSVAFESGITSVGEYAFYLKPLNRVVIPGNIKVLRTGAFMGYTQTGLGLVAMKEGVEEIQARAFFNRAVYSLYIPKSVKKITGPIVNNTRSFRTVVYYAGTADEWNAITFVGDNSDLKNATRVYNREYPYDA